MAGKSTHPYLLASMYRGLHAALNRMCHESDPAWNASLAGDVGAPTCAVASIDSPNKPRPAIFGRGSNSMGDVLLPAHFSADGQ
jgi:hypothetical protein